VVAAAPRCGVVVSIEQLVDAWVSDCLTRWLYIACSITVVVFVAVLAQFVQFSPSFVDVAD
jgi:hypothetical protein